MRYLAVLLFVAIRLAAQGPVLARGRLLESDTSPSGELSIRMASNRVYWYTYDPKTYVEQDQRPTSVARLRRGDQIEIVSDTGPDAALRYARTIHVIADPAENALRPLPFSLGRYAMPRRPIVRDDPFRQELFLRGSLTFAGLVCRLNDERLVLRTRRDGEKTIYLRPDTRYLKDGGVVPASEVRMNTRVFIRGNQSLDGDLEAYQVVWGEIVKMDFEH